MRTSLFIASLLTFGIALWLVSIIVFVLRSRDPGHIGLWAAVATGCAAFSAACMMRLAPGHRPTWLRASVLLGAGAAMTFGGYAAVTTLRQAAGGGHFEGYLVLMGTLLAAHGLTAIAYDRLSAALPRTHRHA